MEWISVNDRLPDKECLAINHRKDIIIGYIGKDGNESYFCESDYEMLEKVTHWMPLPEPPKS